jgi:hypothetical protein
MAATRDAALTLGEEVTGQATAIAARALNADELDLAQAA